MNSRAVAYLAAVSVAATAVNGQLPDGVGDLINLIPPACLIQAQSEVIPCFLENPGCLSNLPTAEEIAMLPIPEEIETCDDLLDPTCPLLLDCESCLEPLGGLLKCIVANLDADVPQETKDLIESCPVECDGGDMGGTPDGNMTIAPAAPVDTPSMAPVATPATMAPSASGSTETTPMPSAASKGVMSLGIAAVAVAAAALSF